MGTRADFYKGNGKDEEMQWLGSIAWDGYPNGIPDDILKAEKESAYEIAVDYFIEKNQKNGSRYPAQGWPWTWDDSGTTDYAYSFFDGKVWATWGRGWFDPFDEPSDDESYEYQERQEPVPFPNMKDIARVTDGGFLIFTSK